MSTHGTDEFLQFSTPLFVEWSASLVRECQSIRVGQQLNMLGIGRMAFVTMLHHSRLLRVVISPGIRWIFFSMGSYFGMILKDQTPSNNYYYYIAVTASWASRLQVLILSVARHPKAQEDGDSKPFASHMAIITISLMFIWPTTALNFMDADVCCPLGFTSCTDTVCPHTPLDWLVPGEVP